MYLKKLDIINFKNYPELKATFVPGINCFLGNNGEGKTNLLDAIYYLSMSKSFFNPVDSQNIRHQEEFFVIQGQYERKEATENIYCGLKKGRRKKFKRNDKDYSKLSEHIGLIPIVMVSPYDSALITDGSEERRKFMNIVISQYDLNYLDNTINYNRILFQRNALLKQQANNHSFDKATIEIYNEQLHSLGHAIFEKRKNFIEELIPVFQDFYTKISRGKETVGLQYSSALKDNQLIDLLNNNLSRDRALQHTSQGVHKDDLVLTLEDYPIKKTGSQGQQKTYLVALKLAKFSFIKKIHKFNPILLLDDIFDKFDPGRVREIINLVSEDGFGQIFITDTEREHLKDILKENTSEARVFIIKDNMVKIQD